MKHIQDETYLIYINYCFNNHSAEVYFQIGVFAPFLNFMIPKLLNCIGNTF